MRLSLRADLALDVVEGRKTDTFRKPDAPRPALGDRATVCVHAGRRDIARVEFTAVELVAADDMDPARRALVAGMVGRHPQYLRLAFRVLDVYRAEIERQNLAAFRDYLRRGAAAAVAV